MGKPERLFIFNMKVSEKHLPTKQNWLGDLEDELESLVSDSNEYEFFFPTFEKMSEKIESITKGFYQYWADISWDLHGNNNEQLEYHNGSPEWDKEIYIETSRIYVTDDLVDSIKEVLG